MCACNLIIRSDQEDDFQAIRDVNRKAFGKSGETRLIEKLRKDQAFIPGLSIVASIKNRILGHILFTRSKLYLPVKRISTLWH